MTSLSNWVQGRRDPIVSAAAAMAHSVVLTRGGAVFTFGADDHGELGYGGRCGGRHGPRKLKTLPSVPPSVRPADAPALRVVEVAGGGHNTLLRMSDGSMYSFGDNYLGQLGNDAVDPLTHGALHPVPVLGLWADPEEKTEGTEWEWRNHALDEWARERGKLERAGLYWETDDDGEEDG